MIYKKLATEFSHRDSRGSLTQLVGQGYSQVNILVSYSGVTRGGHFHKVCREAFYVISGSVTVCFEKDGYKETVDFAEGDFFEIEPYTVHEMYFLEDCVMVALYDKPVKTPEGKDIYESRTEV